MNRTHLLVLAGLLGISNVYANAELCVDPANPHCFNTIQGAVDAAGPGDKIIVFPNPDSRGYRENITINTPGLTLKGVSSGDTKDPTLKELSKGIPNLKMSDLEEEQCSSVIVDGCDTPTTPNFCGGVAFTISAAGVTIDNFTIRHTETAIQNNNADNTAVHDSCVIDSQAGISGIGNGISVKDSTFLGITGSPAILINGNGVSVLKNEFIDTQGVQVIGIQSTIFQNLFKITSAAGRRGGPACLFTTDDAKIEDNKFFGCSGGGIVHSGNNAKILNNQIAFSLSDGMDISGDNVEIGNNEIKFNGGEGISYSGSKSRIFNNELLGAGGPSIAIVRSSDNKISGNHIKKGAAEGIENVGDRNQYEDNLVEMNGKSGIWILFGDRNVIKENRSLNNQGEGINNGSAATNTVIVDNVSLKNRTDICNSDGPIIFTGNEFKTGGPTTPCVVNLHTM